MKTILAVDDSVSIRDMVEFTIRSAGFDVVCAVDGIDALEKLRERSIDLVLTDVNMPNLDGIGLVREVRKMPSLRTLPVLLLTTESSDAMKAQGRSAGATGWIVKPFDPDVLVDVVRRFV